MQPGPPPQARPLLQQGAPAKIVRGTLPKVSVGSLVQQFEMHTPRPASARVERPAWAQAPASLRPAAAAQIERMVSAPLTALAPSAPPGARPVASGRVRSLPLAALIIHIIITTTTTIYYYY